MWLRLRHRIKSLGGKTLRGSYSYEMRTRTDAYEPEQMTFCLALQHLEVKSVSDTLPPNLRQTDG